MHRILLLTGIIFFIGSASGGDFAVEKDISYLSGEGDGDYALERCKLDLYLPKDVKGFATLVWFHGGSIRSGSKDGKIALPVSERFMGEGIAVASVNYRLSPKAKFPAYIEDCAASVAWVIRNIERSGGDPKRVFVSGHSAGGYLAAMVGMDPQFLKKHDLSPNDVGGFIPVSGQMITHSTVRKERGIPKFQPLIDAAAPVFYVRKDAPPFLCLFGDKDLPGRAEENRLFVAFMKAQKNKSIEDHFGADRTHGTIASKLAEAGDPGAQRMLDFIAKHRADF